MSLCDVRTICSKISPGEGGGGGNETLKNGSKLTPKLLHLAGPWADAPNNAQTYLNNVPNYSSPRRAWDRRPEHTRNRDASAPILAQIAPDARPLPGGPPDRPPMFEVVQESFRSPSTLRLSIRVRERGLCKKIEDRLIRPGIIRVRPRSARAGIAQIWPGVDQFRPKLGQSRSTKSGPKSARFADLARIDRNWLEPMLNRCRPKMARDCPTFARVRPSWA